MSDLFDTPLASGELVKTQLGSVLHLEINRPAKRNAISGRLIAEITTAVEDLNDETRCILLTSQGDHFSAGLDLTELQERDALEGVHHSRYWHECLNALQFGRVPIVTVLKGAVIGGGLELAAACHIRVAEKSTYYALPEAARGIFVGGGGSVRLPALMGVDLMMDMMLTGRVLTAEEGFQRRVSQYLCEPSNGFELALSLARRISENTDMTNFAVTQVLPRISVAAPEVGYMTESLIAGMAQDHPEAKSRLKSFLSGREARIQPDQAGDKQ